ncbi:hypothetical protein K431DRAFT_228738 [Polychaeton citri CBS 116435]|uniref:Glycerophosphocholine acyltransferase 1 n=1 Tax=Polychaeton citri CBS 116435 TaxID=1314669 RepID=A0A9P4Q2I2_9PEZI|nr:hypothetical protein K431DRAFT_228738 [Polychaeton citri CBS 116435]
METDAEDYLSVNHAATSTSGEESPGAFDSGLSRTSSNTDIGGPFESFANDNFPPLDRVSMFDILENLALPQKLDALQHAIGNQRDIIKKQRAKIAKRVLTGKQNLEDEWARRKPAVLPADELEKYRRRMRKTVDKIGQRWNDQKNVTLKEKISFVTACLNIFISGYLIGEFPEYFHWWYTAQLLYFMPVRYWTYHKIGYHYFLADLCYFVNLLLTLAIWFFPQSKRLLISTFCLAFGNNAVAIVLWRNSLVFHSFDKVTSLFIHIMPCATLHVMVHLLPKELQRERFPAVYTIKYSAPDTPEHYTLVDMAIWATAPYAIWQLIYHFLITIRRRDKIAQGRPTSFTWLRKSYAKNFLGRLVLSCPEIMQEPVFMGIQYSYAMLTMLPCPLWFWYRWASALFLLVVFGWASWNGATYYIDVFGRRMEKELNALKKEVASMSKSPDMEGAMDGPHGSPEALNGKDGATGQSSALDLGPSARPTKSHALSGSGTAVKTEDNKKDT